MWLELAVEVAWPPPGGGCGGEGEDGLKMDGNDERARKQAGENGENGDNDSGTSVSCILLKDAAVPITRSLEII
jgi:hypothetical protein